MRPSSVVASGFLIVSVCVPRVNRLVPSGPDRRVWRGGPPGSWAAGPLLARILPSKGPPCAVVPDSLLSLCSRSSWWARPNARPSRPRSRVCPPPRRRQHPRAPTPYYEAVTIDNCGFEVTFDRAPQQVVTIKSTSTEMLLALGLGDRIVGTALPGRPGARRVGRRGPRTLPSSPTTDADARRSCSRPSPTWSTPAGSRAFSADGAGAREDLADLGIASYVLAAACRSARAPRSSTCDDDVPRASTRSPVIFDVQDRPDDLVAERAEARSRRSRPDNGLGLTALWYSSGSDTPYVGGGIGAPQLVHRDSVGLHQHRRGDLDADLEPRSTGRPSSTRTPTFIVLIDADWNTAQQQDRPPGRSNPATAHLTAVKFEQLLVTLPFAVERGRRAQRVGPRRRWRTKSSSSSGP